MKKIIIVIIILVIAVVVFGSFRINSLNIAHSTFDNYYKFRGCTQLIEKTDTYGTCKTSAGNTIKIVLINGKWYLDGDGPGIW